MDRILSGQHYQTTWYVVAPPWRISNFWYYSFLRAQKTSVSPMDSFPARSFPSAKQYRSTSYVYLSNLKFSIYNLLYLTISFFHLTRSCLLITSSANCFVIAQPKFLSRFVQFNLLLSTIWLSISKFLGNNLFCLPFVSTFSLDKIIYSPG